jgi:hypothetical protein
MALSNRHTNQQFRFWFLKKNRGFDFDVLGASAGGTRSRSERAEIWDGPASSAVAACEFAKARAITRKKRRQPFSAAASSMFSE